MAAQASRLILWVSGGLVQPSLNTAATLSLLLPLGGRLNLAQVFKHITATPTLWPVDVL